MRYFTLMEDNDGTNRGTPETSRSDTSEQSDSGNTGLSPNTHTTPSRDAGIRAGEIIAFRCWKVKGIDSLYSVIQDTFFWPPYDYVKSDIEWNEGYPPKGIHAFKYQKDLNEYINWMLVPWYDFYDSFIENTSYVWGQVELFGTVIEHELGYRAQYARILSIDGCTDEVNNLDSIRDRYKR